jgi:hypothetical protein
LNFLITQRKRGKLLRAITATSLLKAQEAASSLLWDGKNITLLFRRKQNAALTYDGKAPLTIGAVTIEPISINGVTHVS